MASAVVEINYALRGPAPTLEELEEQLRNLVSAYDALTAAPPKAVVPKRPAVDAAPARTAPVVRAAPPARTAHLPTSLTSAAARSLLPFRTRFTASELGAHIDRAFS